VFSVCVVIKTVSVVMLQVCVGINSLHYFVCDFCLPVLSHITCNFLTAIKSQLNHDCRSLVASLLVVIFRDKMDYATE